MVVNSALGTAVGHAQVESVSFRLNGIHVAEGEAIENGDSVESNAGPGIDVSDLSRIARPSIHVTPRCNLDITKGACSGRFTIEVASWIVELVCNIRVPDRPPNDVARLWVVRRSCGGIAVTR